MEIWTKITRVALKQLHNSLLVVNELTEITAAIVTFDKYQIYVASALQYQTMWFAVRMIPNFKNQPAWLRRRLLPK